MQLGPNVAPARVVGRYALYAEIASGGMATVHFGRLLGPVGFSRTVAIKRLHPQFAKDPEFVSMFLDEARLAARIRHPNVVPTLDVVATDGELFLVIDYLQGESLSKLVRGARGRGQRVPSRIVATILSGALHGLHAAHEARNERGEPLNIVHRDISPQNILVGTDGVARVLDFGVAKAAGRIQTTREGQLKGKLAYMAPEQLAGEVSRKTDVYAAAVVLWEALTGRRLFTGENEAAILGKVISGKVEPPSHYMIDAAATIDSSQMHGIEELDRVTLRGLDRDPARRFNTAREMAIAVERCVGLASPSEVGEWVEHSAAEVLNHRAERVAEIESSSSVNSMTSIANELAQGMSQAGPQAHPSGSDVSRTSQGGFDHSSSQLSSISLSKPGNAVSTAPPPRRLLLAFAIGALGITAIAAVLATVMVLRMNRAQQKAAASADSPTTSALDSNPAATAIAPETASAVASAENTTPLAALDAGTATESTRPAIIPTAHAPSHASHASTKKAAAPSASCDPPWTIDPETGRKKYKLECPL